MWRVTGLGKKYSARRWSYSNAADKLYDHEVKVHFRNLFIVMGASFALIHGLCCLHVLLKRTQRGFSLPALLKTPVHHFWREARDEPMSVTYGARSANDETPNMICAWTPNKLNVMLIVSTQIALLTQIEFYASSIAGNPRRSLWLLYLVFCGKVDEQAFLVVCAIVAFYLIVDLR